MWGIGWGKLCLKRLRNPDKKLQMSYQVNNMRKGVGNWMGETLFKETQKSGQMTANALLGK